MTTQYRADGQGILAFGRISPIRRCGERRNFENRNLIRDVMSLFFAAMCIAFLQMRHDAGTMETVKI